MGSYLPVSDRGVALYGPDVVELALSPTEERDELEGGHLALSPRPFKVLVNNFADGKQGDVVDLTLNVDNEAALVAGDVLERVDVKKKSAKSAARS